MTKYKLSFSFYVLNIETTHYNLQPPPSGFFLMEDTVYSTPLGGSLVTLHSCENMFKDMTRYAPW